MIQSNSHKSFIESLVRSMGNKKKVVNEIDMSNAATISPNDKLPQGGIVGAKRSPKEQSSYEFQRIHTGMHQLLKLLQSTNAGKMPQIQQAWRAMNAAIEQAERVEMTKP